VDDLAFDNTSSCNNTGFETIANMLANHNFDAQIQLTGTVNQAISARTILLAAQSGSLRSAIG
jgi:hypothetical protein